MPKTSEWELIEKLADIEHQRWSDWQKWCHKILRENCPSPELEKVLTRWDKQIKTPYAELTEKEKESDREQVRRYFPIIKDLLLRQKQEVVEIIKSWKYEGTERPSCGDPGCFCGGYEFTEEESNFNDMLDDLIAELEEGDEK